MLFLVLMLAQAAPLPSPAPAPEPSPVPTPRPAALGRAPVVARPKTLSDHAAEMKAKGESPRPVSFDDVRKGTPVPAAGEDEAPDAGGKARGGTAPAKDGDGKAVAAAQKRMDRAVESGLSLPDTARSSAREKARREWDAAADACRRTPGCVPRYRDDPGFGEHKPLKTDEELIDDVRKRGFSEPHPAPK
jgi:hypothetical protein